MISSFSMGQLSYAKTIGTMFSTLYQLISQPFQPTFLKKYSDRDKDGLLRELRFSMKVSGFISSVAFAVFFSLGRVYFTLWIPDQDTNLVYILTMLTVISCLGEGVICPLYYIYTLTVKIKLPCIITIIGGIMNVGSMFVLIEYTELGIYAVVLTTAVISSVTNLIFNPLYMAKCLDILWKSFYPAVFRHLISCFILAILFYAISCVYMPHNWATLIAEACVDVIFGLFIHLFVAFDKHERNRIITKIRENL